MFEFFEKQWPFLIIVGIVGGYILYDTLNERREKERKAQEWKDAQKKAEESKKDKN